MTEEQYLLLVLEEECVELAKVCSKAIRFGLEHKNPDLKKKNTNLLLEEYCDLLAAMKMLQTGGILPIMPAQEFVNRIEAKEQKVLRMMKYSRELRRLN